MSLFGSQSLYADFGSIVDIGMAGDFYFSDGSANNGQVFANLLIQNTWSDSQLWVDVGAGGLVGDTAHSYIKAPQLFYRMGKRSKFNIVVGRELNDWSYLDSHWNMGMTQPLFKWDTAQPEEQGLTGIFVNIPVVEDTLDITLFGSYMYLPTQGASYQLTDGELRSSNPWFSSPIEAITLSGERIDLNYSLTVPKAQDVVFKPSYGLQIGTPISKMGFIASAFYLNKPRNELVLPFEGALNLSTFKGDINILPQVANHQVAGLDIGAKYSIGKTVLSWVREFGIDYDVPLNTTYPVLSDQDIYSLATVFSVSKKQRVGLSYIKVDRQDTLVEGLFSSTQIDAYAARNRFEEAARVYWEGLLAKVSSKYRVKTKLMYTQSLQKDNVWVSADVRWAASRGLEFFTHCDFFGSSKDQIVGEDFISTYQNNDRCLVGGHYAF